MQTRKGHLVLVMAPMGSGKGTLIQYVIDTFPEVKRLVSCTTRIKRPGEVDDVDYHFLSREDFETRIKNGDFIEWAEFSGNLYGTLRTELVSRLERGEIVINEIDLQGVLQLMKLVPETERTIIYIDAGDWDTLCVRARERAPISDTELASRHVRYCEEIGFKDQVDYVIKNGDGELDEARNRIRAIIQDIRNQTINDK